MGAHDSVYKQLFAHARVVTDLLRGFVRESWVRQLDFTTLERVSGEFMSVDLRNRHNDVIWRLLWRRPGLDPTPVYLLLEFQSRPDRFMAVRLLTYLSLLYEDIIRHRALTPSGKLPPVLVMVVYNGNRPWTVARDLESLIEQAPGMLGRSCPRFTYTVLDERRLAPGELGDSSNLAVALIRLEVSTSREEILEVAAEVATQLPRGREPELRQAFTGWLLRALRRTHPGAEIPEASDLEEIPMLEENLSRWVREDRRKARKEGREQGLKQGRKEGLEEGEKKGRVEGARKLLLRLLERRFGPLTPEVRQRIEAISSARQLEAMADEILVAGSLRDLGLD
jgi:predicted transposase YdaD